MKVSCPICHNATHTFVSKNGYNILQCEKCLLGFLHPMPSTKELSEYYNSVNYYATEDRGYISYTELEEGLKKMYREYLSLLKSEYNFNIKNANILDVGCAFGYFLDTASEEGKGELWGVDLNDKGALEMQKKNYKYFHQSFEEAELPENHFDLIFMGDVFEHFTDYELAIQKIKKLLKPGGVVLIGTVRFENFWAQKLKAKWRLMIPPEHTYYWTEPSILKAFQIFDMDGKIYRYNLYVPRDYLFNRIKQHYKLPVFLKYLLPVKNIKFRSFDTMLCAFQKK